MDAPLAVSWDGTLQALGMLAALLFMVAGTAIWIRQRVLGYWLAGWGALLCTGALLLADDQGIEGAVLLASVSDALVAPLFLLGAFDVVGRTTRYRWPLVVGAAAGLVRYALIGADAQALQVFYGVTVAPAFLVATALTLYRAQARFELKRLIALLLVAFAGLEIYDAVADYAASDNRIVWRGLFAVCLPLAALQITACVLHFGAEAEKTYAAKGAIQEERDAANSRLDHVFGHVRELIAEIGEDTRVLYVNDRVRDVLGYTPEELIGRHAIDYVPEPARPAAAEVFRGHMKKGLRGVDGSIDVPARDGSLRSLDYSLSRYEFAGEQRLIVVIRDVTDQRAHERELEEHKRRLEARVEEHTAALHASHEKLRAQERLAAVGTLASGIAHQINNPVGAISAAAEYALLSGDAEDAEAVREESLRRIVAEAARAGRIVRDILRFARHGETTKWPEDLAGVVHRSVEAARDYVAERGGRVEMVVTSDALPVEISPIEIEQMIVNLVYNAAESRESGAHVVVSLSREDDRAVVSVSDDGRGMTSEARAHAFDPFFTTRLREGGSGLGLAIVHRIVEDHRGTIEIASAPESGTAIRIEFPIARGDVEAPAAESSGAG